MRNLKVWQKMALMGVAFMALLAVVTYKTTSTINALGVESARLELHGLAYSVPALALVKDLQLHRDIAHAWLEGDKSLTGPLAAKRLDVENDIQALDDVGLSSALQVTERWAAVRTACHDILSTTPKLSPVQSFASHSRLIADVIALVAEAGHASNLTLDSDVNRKRLADVLVSQGPQLSESLARARGTGKVAAASRERTPEQVENLNRDAVLVEFLAAAMDESVAKALESNETFRTQLDPHASATSDAVLAAMGEIVRLARSDGADVTPAEYFTALTRGVDAITELEGHIVGTLKGSLDDKIAALRRDVLATIGWAGLGLLVVSMVGVVIIRDVTVALRQVVAVANRIALGDLTLSVTSRSRKDEIGVLALAFERMVAALKDTVSMAGRIAAGDLAVTVTPRSDRDEMGKALAHMVERLSALVGDVQQSGAQVDMSVGQIAATTKQHQATATEIAATTSEIRATAKQIAMTSNELVRTMNDVSVVAEESAELAGRGQDGVARMEATMRQVVEAAGSINIKLGVLSEKAGGITQVVTTISKVAGQTNLLSLNAAIEAEKAGEYGRGFAVVATEIRRLADQTAVATYDIDRMVKDIQSAVAAGVTGMARFSDDARRGIQEIQQIGEQLSQVIQQVQALAPRFLSVNEGMQAQATSADQITDSLTQLGEAVQQTVQSLRESNDVIDGLNHAASGMRGGVSRFKVAA